MAITIHLVNLIDPNYSPSAEQFKAWTSATIDLFPNLTHIRNCTLEIVIADTATTSHLNLKYRNKPGPTNVLSFNHDTLPGEQNPFLGEVILCAEVIVEEARDQNKPLIAHYAHLTVHAVLHLLGYDHRTEQGNNTMQALEISILDKLGYTNPYQS